MPSTFFFFFFVSSQHVTRNGSHSGYGRKRVLCIASAVLYDYPAAGGACRVITCVGICRGRQFRCRRFGFSFVTACRARTRIMFRNNNKSFRRENELSRVSRTVGRTALVRESRRVLYRPIVYGQIDLVDQSGLVDSECSTTFLTNN